LQGSSVPDDGGALIESVQPAGPADHAGVKSGDIVVGIDGQKVTSMDALIALILEKNAGDTVTLDVKRGSGTLTLRATLAARQPGE
ncbi:MAG: PDZ domain-containing protein, partial [Actinobacteria bacterium]|nr:PDZ domain-containing protein [Actinomycetota bacterium]